VKESKGDAHKIIITLSETCSRPRLRLIRRSTGATYSVQMMALTFRPLGQRGDATRRRRNTSPRSGRRGKVQDGRDGLEAEDQIITVASRSRPARNSRTSPTGRGRGAVQLVRQHVVDGQNRSRLWHSGARARCGRCAFDGKRCPQTKSQTMSWYAFPRARHRPRRRIPDAARDFMPGGVTPEQVEYYWTC